MKKTRILVMLAAMGLLAMGLWSCKKEKEKFGFNSNGASDALFSVSASKQVHFSKGNLQYQASTGTWRFAEKQYEYIGIANSNISSSYNGWIDLFGWGTSGWNSGAVAYHPWSTSNIRSDYYPGGSYTNSLADAYANADWGVYNAISNGGNQAGMWRTLTYDEWNYLLFTRSGIYRYVKATVNGVAGMIVFPDNFTLPRIVKVTGYNTSGMTYSTNVYDQDSWAVLQDAGCIFLPATGDRWGTSVNEPGKFGGYWSSSPNGESYAWGLRFRNNFADIFEYGREDGLSVRLVQDAN